MHDSGFLVETMNEDHKKIENKNFNETITINIFNFCTNNISQKVCNVKSEKEYRNFITNLSDKRIDIKKLLSIGILCQEHIDYLEKETEEKFQQTKEIFLDFSEIDDIDDIAVLQFINLLQKYDLKIVIDYAKNPDIYYRFLDRGIFYYLKDGNLYIFCKEGRRQKTFILPRKSQIISGKILPIIDIDPGSSHKELFEKRYESIDKQVEDILSKCLIQYEEYKKYKEKIKAESGKLRKPLDFFQEDPAFSPFEKVLLKYISLVSPNTLLNKIDAEDENGTKIIEWKSLINTISIYTTHKLNKKEYYYIEDLFTDLLLEITTKKSRNVKDKELLFALSQIREMSLDDYIEFINKFFEHLEGMNISYKIIQRFRSAINGIKKELYIDTNITQSILHILYDIHITGDVKIMSPLVRRLFIKNIIEELGMNIYIHSIKNDKSFIKGFICGRYLETEAVKKRIGHFSYDLINRHLEDFLKRRDKLSLFEFIISDNGDGILARMEEKMTKNDKNLLKDSMDESMRQKRKLELLFDPESNLELSIDRERKNIGIPSFLKVLRLCEGFCIVTTCSEIMGNKYAFRLFVDGKSIPSIEKITDYISTGTNYTIFAPALAFTHKFVESSYEQKIIDKYEELRSWKVFSVHAEDLRNNILTDMGSNNTIVAIDVGNLDIELVNTFIAYNLPKFYEKYTAARPYICLYNISEDFAKEIVSKEYRIHNIEKPIIIISSNGNKYVVSNIKYERSCSQMNELLRDKPIKVDVTMLTEFRELSVCPLFMIDLTIILKRDTLSLDSLSANSLIFPLEILIRDTYGKLILWNILENKMKSKEYIIPKNENEPMHVALRSGVHIDKFHVVERLYEDCWYVDLMAICVAEDIIKKIKTISNNKTQKEFRCKVIGYGRYASAFLFTLGEMILKLIPDELKSIILDIETIEDRNIIKERQRERDYIIIDEKTNLAVLINPIATTFNTTDEILKLIDKKCAFTIDWNFKTYLENNKISDNLEKIFIEKGYQISDEAKILTISKTEWMIRQGEIEYNIIEKEPNEQLNVYIGVLESLCIVHIGPMDLGNGYDWILLKEVKDKNIIAKRKQGYGKITIYSHIEERVFPSESCPYCKEKILIECDIQSVHPKILTKKDHIKEYTDKNYIDIEKFLGLVEKTKAAIYKHVYSETNHYLFFFRAEKILEHIKRKTGDYPEFDKFRRDFKECCLKYNIDTIFVPNQTAALSLAKYLNYDLALKIFIYNRYDKVDNFSKYHENEVWGNVVIVDDGINSGTTFNSLRTIVNNMNGNLTGFATLVDRSPSYIKREILNNFGIVKTTDNHYVPRGNGFYLPFITLGLPLVLTPEKCHLCSELEDIKDLENNAVDQNLKKYLSEKIIKLEPNPIREKLFYDYEKLLEKNQPKIERIKNYIIKKHQYYIYDDYELKEEIEKIKGTSISDIVNSDNFEETILDRSAFLKIYGFPEVSEYELFKSDIYRVLQKDFDELINLDFSKVLRDEKKQYASQILLYLLKYCEILLKVLGKWKVVSIIEPENIIKFDIFLKRMSENLKEVYSNLEKSIDPAIDPTNLFYYQQEANKQNIKESEQIIKNLNIIYIFAAKRSLFDRTRSIMFEHEVESYRDRINRGDLLFCVCKENNYIIMNEWDKIEASSSDLKIINIPTDIFKHIHELIKTGKIDYFDIILKQLSEMYQCKIFGIEIIHTQRKDYQLNLPSKFEKQNCLEITYAVDKDIRLSIYLSEHIEPLNLAKLERFSIILSEALIKIKNNILRDIEIGETTTRVYGLLHAIGPFSTAIRRIAEELDECKIDADLKNILKFLNKYLMMLRQQMKFGANPSSYSGESTTVEKIDLSTLINENVELARSFCNFQIGPNSVTFKVNYDEKCKKRVRVYKDAIDTAITTLIDNSLKHGIKEGNIIMIDVSQQIDHIKISFSDKNHHPEKWNYGIGLNYVNYVCKLHNGSLTPHEKSNDGVGQLTEKITFLINEAE